MGHRRPPGTPTGAEAIGWLLAALALYALATLLRAERWHHILAITGVHASRPDCYGLTCVGYMGNNVLPARAGEVLRVVLLAPRCDASKRTVAGSIVAERLLDVVALATIFVVVVYGVLSSTVLPTDRPILVAGIGVLTVPAGALAVWVLRRQHVFERPATGCARWPTPRGLCSAARGRAACRDVRALGLRGRRLPRRLARSTSTSA